jgi:signal transduction histidine kinase
LRPDPGALPLLHRRLAGAGACPAGPSARTRPGIEGGIWQTQAGPLAYAYPTYQGSGPKTDLPAAERDRIQNVNQRAARDQQPAAQRIDARSQVLLLNACPLDGLIAGLTGWTMTRVQSNAILRPLQKGVGVLLGLMLLMSAWLGRTLQVWGRHVRDIEAALGRFGGDGIPAVPATGERELDRIIDALNDAGHRLAVARSEAEQLASRVARAERLAGLGRVAAGVAHELRNPLAAARLQGENALVGDDARRRSAIGAMLGQIDRLDALAGELLAMTQRVTPDPVRIDLAAFLAAEAERHQDIAAARSVTLTVAGAGSAWLDPAVIGRVLDNLLTNAIRHAPAGGRVTLAAERSAGWLTLTVADTGPGVPADMTDRLFEPFVTGRADGTGLGLAIARELADAHHGRLTLRGAGPGAVFALELPEENLWPRS